ncbi:MAG: D-alanyl-D-alanine carboxypeptidase [Negativicutes bacterium]|nr:D-alanyl-D-alanine carboxypeptidase [Negativicutes bacterium]
MIMNKFRRLILLTILTLLLAVPQTALAATPYTADCKAAILMDQESGQILLEQNANEQLAPASITKVMTMYVAMEALMNSKIALTDVVTVSKEAWEIGESSMFLNVGDKVTVEQLLQGLCVVSGNDAAICLAEHIGGSLSGFVAMMNAQAKELGMTHSHFANPHGLDAKDHYMSAADIAALCSQLYKNHPQAVKYFSQSELTYGDITQANRNPMLGKYPGVDGIKTGFTDNAGYSIAVSSLRNDWRLIAVIMGAESEETRVAEAGNLLDYGFRNFDRYVAGKKGSIVTNVAVRRGRVNSVDLLLAEDAACIIARGDQENVVVTNQIMEITAPFTQGQALAAMDISYKGVHQKTVDLIAANEVAKANFFKVIWQEIYGFFSGLIHFG